MTYKIVTSEDPNPAKLESQLNELAADGYRVVAIFGTAPAQPGFAALLGRKVHADATADAADAAWMVDYVRQLRERSADDGQPEG